jgi:hypothetical protein
MWITSATINETIDMNQLNQLIAESAAERASILAEGAETGGNMLPPYNDAAAAAAAFAPGAVFKRGWDLESSARRMVDFVNNHESKQMIAVVEQQDI